MSKKNLSQNRMAFLISTHLLFYTGTLLLEEATTAEKHVIKKLLARLQNIEDLRARATNHKKFEQAIEVDTQFFMHFMYDQIADIKYNAGSLDEALAETEELRLKIDTLIKLHNSKYDVPEVPL